MLIAAACLLHAGGAAAEPLLPCSSMDAAEIMVPEGFDCEVFATRFAAGGGLFRIDQCLPSAPVKFAALSGARRTAFGPAFL